MQGFLNVCLDPLNRGRRAELRGLPWFCERGCVGFADSQRALSKAAAIGDQWGRGRGRLLVLENQAWYSSDGHARIQVLTQRPADMDTCAVPEAYEQTAAYSAAGLAASPELAVGICEGGPEIALTTSTLSMRLACTVVRPVRWERFVEPITQWLQNWLPYRALPTVFPDMNKQRRYVRLQTV